MTKLEAALLDLTSFLEGERVPYMVIGGFANLHWGVERFTNDLDVTIEVNDDALENLIRGLGNRFTLSIADALTFARRNHLIRLETPVGVPAHLIIAALPYEMAALRRAIPVDVAGKSLRLCSPEDLIIHKLASERPQDSVDVEGLVLRQCRTLDRAYLATRVRELAEGLERPQIVGFYETLLRRADSLAI